MYTKARNPKSVKLVNCTNTSIHHAALPAGNEDGSGAQASSSRPSMRKMHPARPTHDHRMQRALQRGTPYTG
ncbi:hypothetical protein NT01EI_0416 [Edwardsiella ictaluri 93-146]|uniref:Uncharacterized protein n=1 Tax=Edwardsiella ictaluri (strain 93-146) TaxID=634503 RepID=C5BF68_EDWI9|nr:hypothetical protein NT01EI_0416 [Edwardsiella ictaluri 93-146]